MKPVLSEEFTRDLGKQGVYIARIEPANASNALRILSSTYPLDDLRHLKRIKRTVDDKGECQLQIIICMLSEVEGPQEIIERLSQLELPLSPVIAYVAKYPPFQKYQFDRYNSLWPLIFHDVHKLAVLSTSELRYISQYMRIASENMTRQLQMHPNQVCVGAIIVDPKTNKILAMAQDARSVHPLHHATMQCISLVSRNNLQVNLESIAHGSLQNDNYLCTGYDLYVTREPCVMCAMALVHSRIRRVFYGVRNPEFGGLGSIYKIHVHPNLNHHYDVFEEGDLVE